MKFKYRILLGFGVFIIIFIFVIIFNLVFLNHTAQRIHNIVDTKFITEKYIQDSYQIILAIHADIWDTMLFSPENRQSAINDLNEKAKAFYNNLHDLSKQIPGENSSLKQISDIFRTYYVFGSTILKLKDLQEFKNQIDTVNKFKENKTQLTVLLDKTVSASKKGFEQSLLELNNSFRNIGFITAILTIIVIIIAVFIALFLAGRLTRPIEYLTSIARKVADGDYKIRASVSTHGEVLVLANTFNNMLKEIEEYSDHMEDLVKKRTEELNESNKMLTAANGTMKKELKMARAIQQALIPSNFPDNEKLSIGGNYSPMEDLGGDFYDVFNIDEKKVGIVIADVSGHGVPAALVTAMAKISFTTNSIPGRQAGEIVGHVNKELCSAIEDLSQYLTVFYCIIDTRLDEIQYCNAGHDEIFIIRNNKELIELKTNSPIVGNNNKQVYSTSVAKLNEGDKLVLYTDGIPEARNNNSEFFGMKKFKTSLLQNCRLSVQEMVLKVFDEVYLFIGNAPVRDDITLLIVEMLFAPEGLKVDLEILNTTKISSNPQAEMESNFIEGMEKYIKALTFYKKGKYNDIFPIVEGIIPFMKRKDEKIKLYNLLAFSYYKTDRIEDALKYWQMVLDLDPDNYKARSNINFVAKRFQ